MLFYDEEVHCKPQLTISIASTEAEKLMLKGRKRLPPLSETHPELLLEWHPSRNQPLSPDSITQNSHLKVWWQCLANPEHVYQRSIAGKTKLDAPCPYCKLSHNSFAARHPDLCDQWHPKLNGKLTPQDVHAGSARKVWWQCPRNTEHVYESSVYARGTGSGCHFCNWIKRDSQRNLKARDPELAREWHPKKNGALRPEDVAFSSKRKVWWLCRQDRTHEWEAAIGNRTSPYLRAGCPFCSGSFLSQTNRLSDNCPEIAGEWHPTKNRMLWPRIEGSWRPDQNRRVPPQQREKNRRLQPSDVATTSHEYAWWRCKKGHEWQAMVADRVRYQSGCPYCTNQKVCGDNNLQSLYPKLEKIWHPTRNLPLQMKDVVPGSGQVVWWRCAKAHDHVWQAPVGKVVQTRKANHSGCPFCIGKKICPSNSLRNGCPEAAAFWHPTKNRLAPESVHFGSNSRAWWLCGSHHSFKAIISQVTRSVKKRGRPPCPYCSGRRASPEDNLAVRYPAIAKLWWHKELNLPLRPEDIRHGSGKTYWWRCTNFKEHTWQARVIDVVRAHRGGYLHCPRCTQR